MLSEISTEETKIMAREHRRAAQWRRRQQRLDRRHPARPSRLGEAGTARGACVDVGCVDGDWIAPPPVSLTDGTSIRLYKDGQGLTAALQGIASAREQICLEVYIFHSDETGRAFAEALSERARAGVRVFVIYDSFGSIDTDPRMFRSMRKAGVHLAEFHPLRPWDGKYSWRPLNRDHRKLLVIDDHIAGLGGLNVGAEYGSGFLSPRARRCELWRDNAIGVTGPGAAMFAECFRRTWQYVHRGGVIRRAEMVEHIDLGQKQGRVAGVGAKVLADPGLVPDIKPESRPPRLRAELGLMASVPSAKSPLVPFLRSLVHNAQYSLDLTMAYFAPSDVLIGELMRAARRGVHVRLMFPGRCDVKAVSIAAHAFYEPLLTAGVEIWERQSAVLHAKTMVIDEDISVIGSTNLDYRSIEFNCELSAVIHSRPLARQMIALFQHDTNFAQKIELSEWRRRPLRDKFVQWVASRARYLL
jgi:cardiolipin synthase